MGALSIANSERKLETKPERESEAAADNVKMLPDIGRD
jgi:hypothetical protein